MSNHPDTTLIRGLEMTQKMLELLQAGEWEAVAELAQERLQLLGQWDQSMNMESAQANIGILQEIQVLDRQIAELGRQGRDDAAGQLRQIHQGRKADKAYRG